MSTFQDLIQRVEQSNTELVSIRDTIERESIDSTSALIDTLRDEIGALDTRGYTTGSDDPRFVPSMDVTELDKSEFLESIANDINGMYTLMLSQDRDSDREDFVPAPMIDVVDVIKGKQDKEDDGRGMFSIIGGLFKGLLGKLLTLGIIGLIANELLNFFGVTGKELFNKVAEGIDLAFSSEGWAMIGKEVDKALRAAIDFVFRDEDQEATLGRYVEKGAIYGLLGRFLIGGPWGLLIGAVFGLITEYFTTEDAKAGLTVVQEKLNELWDAFANIFDEIVSWFTGAETGSFRLKMLDERLDKVKDAEARGEDQARIGLFEKIDRGDIQKEYDLVARGAVEDVIDEQKDVDRFKALETELDNRMSQYRLQLEGMGRDPEKDKRFQIMENQYMDLQETIIQEQKEVLQARNTVREIEKYGDVNNLSTQNIQQSYSVNPQTDKWELNYE